jgi:WD40 repeat protein
MATGQQIGKPLGSASDGTDSVASSPDGKTLVTGGDQGITQLWDASTGLPVDGSC